MEFGLRQQSCVRGDWRSVTLICGALEEHLLTYLLNTIRYKLKLLHVTCASVSVRG